MFNIILISLILLLIALFYYASLKKAMLEIIPTLAWCTFMVIPFLYSRKFFDITGTNSQFLGIALVYLALLVGDWYSVKTKSKPVYSLKSDIKIMFNHKIQLFLITIVIVIPVIHTLISGTSPLFDLIFRDSSRVEVSMDRALYTKFGVTYFFSILSNWTINIIMPFLVTWLFVQKKYYWTFVILAWSLLYAINSTAKLPVIFLVVSISFILIVLRFKSFANIFGNVIIVVFAGLILSGIYFGNAMLNNIDKCPPSTGIVKSPANISRSCPSSSAIGLNPVISTVGYRIFLTPVEVSNHWYNYFSTSINVNRSLFDLFERNTLKKTANLIGREYYVKPFPNSYNNSITAYASIDADAFSFGGLLLVLLVSILLISIRIFISSKGNNSPPEIQAFEYLALVYLILLPFTASIQAILIPQGLLPVLLVVLYLRKLNRNGYTQL